MPLPRPDARLRLYCLPWAGAGAGAYRSWAEWFPPSVEVVPVALPGRERRLGEPPLRTVEAVADALVPVLADHIDRPYAVFGHSMGALVGYESVCRLTEAGRPPVRLVASGSRAPHRPLREAGLHPLPRDRFLRAVRRLQPEPGGALDSPEMAELVAPALQADFTAAETYLRPVGGPLGCPVSALGGTADPLVDERDLRAWERHTTGPFACHTVEGGHLFVTAAAVRVRETVLAALDANLDDLVRDE
ncbi:thioesterase II family protein [Streptomyces griseoruber]|uniref:thioesterase II family protein n=1 Tax=Streptomyces griseoruber TaxID=1943 RepID=UPI001F0A44CE|nr:thioesterase domain-containing protein [Streptomyces griseoruber]